MTTPYSTYDNSANRADYIINCAKALPATQPVAFKLFNLFQERNHHSNDLINLIRYDSILTANILRVSNSALYRRSQSTDTLDQAVMRLGDAAIINIVTTQTMNEMSKIGAPVYVPQDRLWQHSVFASIAGRHLVRVRMGLNVDMDIVFTTCLLHDLGKVVINASALPEVTQIHELAKEKGCSILEAERGILGADHAFIASRLLFKWGVDRAICAAIHRHHLPYDEDTLTAVCIASNYLARRAEGSLKENEKIDRRLVNALDLDDYMLNLIDNAIKDEGAKTLSAFSS